MIGLCITSNGLVMNVIQISGTIKEEILLDIASFLMREVLAIRLASLEANRKMKGLFLSARSLACNE